VVETLEALDTLVQHGHVRHSGLSNWAAWQMVKAVGVTEARRLAPILSLQGLLHGGWPRSGTLDRADAQGGADRADGLEPARRRLSLWKYDGEGKAEDGRPLTFRRWTARAAAW
jgi:hypothetical protein